jgi:hypothetical protein
MALGTRCQSGVMVREKVEAGLTRAERQGKQLGRPRVELETERKTQTALSAGKVVVGTAGALASALVQRVKSALRGIGYLNRHVDAELPHVPNARL